MNREEEPQAHTAEHTTAFTKSVGNFALASVGRGGVHAQDHVALAGPEDFRGVHELLEMQAGVMRQGHQHIQDAVVGEASLSRGLRGRAEGAATNRCEWRREEKRRIKDETEEEWKIKRS